MIRGIIVSRGPLAVFSCERKGVCVAGLLLCAFENRSERAATFRSARKEPASPCCPPDTDDKKRQAFHTKSTFIDSLYGHNDRMIKYCYFKKLQPLYNHSIFKYLLLSLLLSYSCFLIILIIKHLNYPSQRVSKPWINSFSSTVAIVVIRLSLLQRLIH